MGVFLDVVKLGSTDLKLCHKYTVGRRLLFLGTACICLYAVISVKIWLLVNIFTCGFIKQINIT